MKTLSFLAVAITFLSFSQAHAADACLDQRVMDSVKEKVTLVGDNWETFDPCNASSNTYKMWETLSLIKQMTFANGRINIGPLNQDILPTDFWGYFSGRVSYMVNEAECRDGIVAFVFGGLNDRVVHLCPLFYEPSQNVYDRVETILHEARHFEGFRHVTCNRGPRLGKDGACDNNIQEKGSYAVTVESFAKMALLADGVPAPMRAMLKNSSVTYDEAFNEPILPEGFQSTYILSKDKQSAYMFDGQRTIEVPAITSARLISRRVALAAFPLDKSDAYTLDTYSRNFDVLPAQGSFSLGYNKTEKALRPEILDVVNGSVVGGNLTRTSVNLRTPQDKDYTAIPLNFRAERLFLPSELGIDSKDSGFVLSSDGKMYQAQMLGNGLSKVTEVPNTLGNLQNIIFINDKKFALTKTGEILALQDNAQWTPVSVLNGKQFDSMTRAFNWTEYFANESTSR